MIFLHRLFLWPILAVSLFFLSIPSAHAQQSPSLLSDVVQIAAGSSHTCALTTAGGVKCWGSNHYGQLGDGTTINKWMPVDVHGLSSGVAAITAGGLHTCALTTAGAVKCWGDNYYGTLGDGTTNPDTWPVAVQGLDSGVTAIAAGGFHTCALTTGGGVKCWGDNRGGLLGGGTEPTGQTPVDVSGLSSGVSAITVGSFRGRHMCALLTDGTVKCWGSNQYGQLGDGTNRDRTAPVDVSGLSGDVTAFSAGDAHTCAVLTDGTLACWGHNTLGQLGNGTTISTNSPVVVEGLGTPITAVEAGMSHTCALTTVGDVQCWGHNGMGQLGNGTERSSTTPISVIDLETDAVAIATHGRHTCALTTAGTVQCWGYNMSGQLGDGTTGMKQKPTTVHGLSSDAVTVGTGGFHTCALSEDGYLYCWGQNTLGSLGIGITDIGILEHKNIPAPVGDLENRVAAVSTGFYHTCAVLTDGSLKCWGSDMNEQLGNGADNGSQASPFDVTGLISDVVDIGTFWAHTCAVMATGDVACWGVNHSGQLGDGTTIDRPTPVLVQGLEHTTIAVTNGHSHTCSLTDIGTVYCWGDNTSGQLGNGTTLDQSMPIEVHGLSRGVVDVQAGQGHTCALLETGKVKCWGSNGVHQLGNSTRESSNVPIDVPGLEDVSAISVGASHTCAVTSTGIPYCWGYSEEPISSFVHIDSPIPEQVDGLGNDIIAIGAGWYHTCALSTADGLQCWGLNSSGQLGDGSSWRTTPMTVMRGFQTFLPTVSRKASLLAPLPTITETLTARGNFTILLDGLMQTGVIDELSRYRPVTLFAPTDVAFMNLLEEYDLTKEQLLSLPEFPDVLRLHILKTAFTTDEIEDGTSYPSLLSWYPLWIETDGNTLLVYGTPVAATDMRAADGVIHDLDTVFDVLLWPRLHNPPEHTEQWQNQMEILQPSKSE